MCVSTVLLESGILPMEEPETRFTLEAPGGLVRVKAVCANGRVESVTVQNVPSFAAQLSVPLDVEGLGRLTVDTAYGGDSFVIVDAEALGFELTAAEAKSLTEVGMRITRAANEQLGFLHPENPDWAHISFCLFTGPLSSVEGGLTGRHAVVVEPGKIDRSPTGTAVSARMAVLHAKGELEVGGRFVARSIIDSRFEGQIVDRASVGDLPAIVPTVTGRAWVTGTYQLMLDPKDPWPEGYRIGDTWPQAGAGKN